MKVAVGIIVGADKRVLITQRPLHVTHGGYWEFPGGKLDENESAELALVRELKEELGIEVTEFNYLGELHHQYPKVAVHLIVFLVTQWMGTPQCLEGQLQMVWALPEEIPRENFPAANQGIFAMI